MVDAVAGYWTVVPEAEVDDLAGFERHMREYGTRSEVCDALAGYRTSSKGATRDLPDCLTRSFQVTKEVGHAL